MDSNGASTPLPQNWSLPSPNPSGLRVVSAPMELGYVVIFFSFDLFFERLGSSGQAD